MVGNVAVPAVVSTDGPVGTVTFRLMDGLVIPVFRERVKG
jgi:hypothetical protein